MDLRSFGPYNIFWVTDRFIYCHMTSFGPYNIFLVTDLSIYCHMTLSAMNYLLYMLSSVCCLLNVFVYKLLILNHLFLDIFCMHYLLKYSRRSSFYYLFQFTNANKQMHNTEVMQNGFTLPLTV
jgi:hypothetical protein